MIKWPTQANKIKFYGNPDKNRDGVADPAWVKEYLTTIIPPFPMYYPKEVKGKLIKRGHRWKAFTVNKMCAASLLECLTQIPKVCTAKEIEQYELDLCGGVFVFRLKRSGTSLSEHSWGSAIDLSHLVNYYKRPYNEAAGMMPMKVAKIFTSRGWTWLQRNDAMHFQAVGT